MNILSDIRKIYTYVFFVFGFTFLLAATPRVWAESFEYSQITGQTHTRFKWHVEKQNNATELIVINNNDVTAYVSKNNALLEVTQWLLKNPNTNTELTAQRQKNSIFIKGTFEGRPFSTTLSIDAAPWYQPMSFSLTALVLSEADSITFWTLNPDNLKPFKMKAIKVKTEIIKINEKEIPAQKVKVSLTGLRSAFWHAYYWFSRKDGVFIQYEGIDGPPGTPATVITLIAP